MAKGPQQMEEERQDATTESREERKTHDCLVVQVVIPLMCLFELLELVHAGGDGLVASSGGAGAGDRLSVSIVLDAVTLVGSGVLDDAMVRLSPSERLPKIERHVLFG